jgi:hypothetical protein
MRKYSGSAMSRLERDGCYSDAAIRRRLIRFASERNIPDAELKVALRGVKPHITAAVKNFCERHDVSVDWLIYGSLEKLRAMTKPVPEPTLAEVMEVMRQLPQRERSIFYKTITKRAREATSGS